nr:MAG TPA: hypothetical protein [Caudoviricetes sp.]
MRNFFSYNYLCILFCKKYIFYINIIDYSKLSQR